MFKFTESDTVSGFPVDDLEATDSACLHIIDGYGSPPVTWHSIETLFPFGTY